MTQDRRLVFVAFTTNPYYRIKSSVSTVAIKSPSLTKQLLRPWNPPRAKISEVPGAMARQTKMAAQAKNGA
ncbi:unnamed protein product [Dibothriocephalus latus]|uniref:Uncharacterized protein n=1 Tax=Dibothriocephalus latus TaxID=60516 RepID=A0A3P7N1K3_DIBLA|nr:unnamed protein product [Dibothriocephalus latus]